MTKFKKREVTEEDLAKAKLELDEDKSDSKDDEDESESESDKDELDKTDDSDKKKDKKSFDEKCKDKTKGYLIKKENLNEIKTLIPEGVSEEFVENFDTIVVGLINEQVQKISEMLIADFIEEMDSTIEEAIDTHKEYINKFLDVELDNFKETQKEAIVSNLKLEKANQFLTSLRTLFTENHFILDDDKIKQVSDADDKVAKLEAEINQNYEKITALKESMNEKEVSLQLNELTSSLNELDKVRLTTMLEGHNKKDLANYIKEAQKIKSFLLNETLKKNKEDKDLDIVTEDEAISKDSNLSLNELIQKYINKV